MKKPVRILIVEDNSDDVDLAKHEIQKVLNECAFQIAQTRESFIKTLSVFQPDVILADYTLPQFDGMKALQLSLHHAPLTPFIIWTGSKSEDVAVECVKAGANNYILKDNLKRLGPAIVHAIEQRGLLLARNQAEEKAQEHQRQMETLFSNVPGPVYRRRNDANFTMEFISDRIEELSGYKAEDFRQHRQHFGKMIHPEDREQVWTDIQIAVARNEPFELTYRILTASREQKWVWEKGQGIYDTEGQLEALEGFITDITVRKKAEQKYQSIFENSVEGIFQSTPQGRYINLNPAMARLYGYESPNEMITSVRNIASQIYVEPDQRARFMSLLHSQNSIENFEARNYRKDGSIIWTSTSARIVRDQNGNVLYYEGFLQDITQRKTMEEAFQNNEKRFRALIENGLDDISLLARDGTLLWESPSTIRNLGYAPNEFIGRNIFQIMHPEDLEWTRKIYTKLIQEPGGRQRGTFRLQRADGSWRWVEAIATNMLDEPSVCAIVINYRDVTEQKQAEIELKQRNADLGLINTLNELVNRGQALDVILSLVRSELKSIFSSDYINIYLLDQDRQSIQMQHSSLPPDIVTRIERLTGRAIPDIHFPLQEDGFFQRVLRAERGVVISGPESIQLWLGEFVEAASLSPIAKTAIRKLLPQIYKILNINSTILVPLISDGSPLGLVNVSGSNLFTEQDRQRIENICGQLTTALRRKQVEEALQEERNLLRTLIDNIPDRIYAMDIHGRKTLSNTADWKASGGKTMENVIGKTDFDTYPPGMAQEFWRLDRAVLDSGQPVINFEEPGLDADGQVVSILTTKIPLRDHEGKVIGLVGIGRDITERRQTQERINDLLAFNEKILNHSPMGILTYKFTGECIFANENAAVIAGTDVEQLRALNFHTLESWKKSGFYDLVQKAMSTHAPVTADIHHVSPFGKEAWITVHCTTFKLKGEEHLLIFLTDITERKLAEEKLLRSQRDLAEAQEIAKMGNWSWDVEKRAAYWSDETYRIFGVEKDTFQPTRDGFMELVHPEDRSLIEQTTQAVLEEGGSFNIEYRIRTPDGHSKIVNEIGYPQKDIQGNVVSIFGLSQDITERKQAEEALRQSQDRYRALVETQTDFIVRWQPDGTRTFANEAYRKYFGLTAEDSSSFVTLIHEEDRLGVENKIQRLAAGITDLETDIHRVVRPDGSIGWHEWTDQAIRDDHGRLIELQSVGRDITERKRAETERQALFEITQGLASTRDLPQLLELVHRSIAKVIYAENFFVILHQESTGLFEEIYSVDQYDPPAPPSKLENSITSYVFRSGQPLLLTQSSFEELTAQGEVKLVGTPSASWLGVPLKTSGRTIGVMAVQDYENDNRYAEREKEFLASIAAQVALLIEHRRAGQALRESEEHYRTIFEGVQDAIFVESLDGKILMVNERACEMFGYSQSEFLTRTVADLVPRGFPILMEDGTEMALSTEPRETVNQRANGEIFPVEISGRVQVINGDNVLLVVVRDITERKRVEGSLRAEQRKAEKYLETAGVMMLALDQEGTVTLINQKGCEILGYSAGEIIGKNWIATFLPEPTRKELQDVFQKLISDDPHAAEYYENPVVTKSGEERLIAWHNTLLRDEQGRIVSSLSSGEDITERKKVETALIESNTQFRTLFEASPDAIVLIDPRQNWSIIDCNTAACQMNGYSREELLGQCIDILNTTPGYPDERVDYLERVRQHGVLRYETYHRRKDGTPFTVDVSTSIFRLGNREVILGIDRDVTERKRAEEEIHRAAKETSALLKTSLALTNLDLEVTLQTIGNSANSLFVADGCRVFLMEPDGETLRCVLALEENIAAFSNLRIKLGQGVTGAVAASGKAEIVNDMLNDPRAVQVAGTEEEPEAIMFAPLKERDRTIGILSIRRVGEERPFVPADLALLEAFASMAASAVSNARLFEETQRRLAELNASEERFRQLADNIQEAFWMTDAETGKELYMSPAVETIWGRPIQSMMYQPDAWIDSVFSEDRPALVDVIRREKNGEKIHCEYRIVRPDGSLRWIWDRAFPIVDESGSVSRIAGISADITERRESELALARSQNRYRELFDSSPISIWEEDFSLVKKWIDALQRSGVTDLREYLSSHPEIVRELAALVKITDVNKASLELYGVDRKEDLLLSLADISNSASLKHFEEEIIELTSPLKRFSWEGADVTSSGRSIEVLVNGSIPQGYEQDWSKVIVSVIDITERKEAAEKLRESEDRYHSLFQNQLHGSALHEIITDDQGQPVDYIFLKVNPAFENMTGLKADDIIGRRVTEVISGIENERLIQIYGEVALTGKPVHLQEYFAPLARYYEINAYSTGSRRFAVSFVDVTERRQAEQELRKLSRAVEQSGSTIVITDTAGNIEYVNPKFTQVTGYSFEEVLGQNPRLLKSGLTAAEEYKRLWQTINNGCEWHGELLNKKKNGELFWESVTISPILNKRREITHFVGVKEDITERKQNEIEIRRHIAELEALYENGLSVGRLLEPSEIGNRVIETFAHYLPWHHVTIRLKKEGSDDLELVAFNLPNLKEEERIDTEQHFVARINKVGQGLSGWVIQTGQPFRTGNVHAHPQYIDTHAGIQSGLYMPLTIGERVIGVISVESELPQAFTEQDERLLATLANQTAIAFENARLYEAMQKELSERKRVEDALRISETHYRVLADSITDILFEMDQDLHYTHWNKASENLTGILAQDAIGKPMEETFGATEEQARIRAIFEEVLTSHQPRTFETALDFHGEKRSFEVNAYPSMRGVSVVAKDVTDRKRTETIMQKRFELMEFSARHSLNELMLKTVDEVSELTGSTIGFFHFMQDDQVNLGMQTWSTNALRLFQVAPEDGGHLSLDQAGVWADAVRQRRPLIQNSYKSLTKKKGFPQGHVPIVREIVVPIIRNERIMAVISVANKSQEYTSQDLEVVVRLADYAWDITERKQMEQALEIERNQLVLRVEERTADLSRANSNLARALRVKDEFLANMSHELRTPLNAILGLSESLAEQIAGPLNEKQQKYISTIGESGHHLLSLINDILDLAKIDAGQITMDINKVDVHSVCQASLRMIKQLAQKKNQEVSLEIDNGLGLMWADERRLKQMVVNLLGNAVKFTPENGRLGLEVHGDEDANQISITVWDNGIGIKQEDLARLFQPFVQLDSGLAREATGTGLGLALVAQMARLHGGSVNATSEAGKGSRFTIILPWEPALAIDTASRMRITDKFRAIKVDETNKLTILLVEDTKEVVMMIKDYLELAGYQVFTAQDGMDGIVQARRHKPDLILMDVQMPRMDGFETTRKLRSDPNFRYTPIIALTALAMPHDRERCLESGMDEYISKPVNLKALIKIIQSCLFEQRAHTR